MRSFMLQILHTCSYLRTSLNCIPQSVCSRPLLTRWYHCDIIKMRKISALISSAFLAFPYSSFWLVHSPYASLGIFLHFVSTFAGQEGTWFHLRLGCGKWAESRRLMRHRRVRFQYLYDCCRVGESVGSKGILWRGLQCQNGHDLQLQQKLKN